MVNMDSDLRDLEAAEARLVPAADDDDGDDKADLAAADSRLIPERVWVVGYTAAVRSIHDSAEDAQRMIVAYPGAVAAEYVLAAKQEQP